MSGQLEKEEHVDTDKLAIHGGSKAVPRLGSFPTKIGKEELL